MIANDEEYFLSALDKHQGILHRLCRLYADTEEERKDLFQEMTIQLWRGFPSFRKDSKISTWMYRVALNTAISSIRKSKRRIKEAPLSSETFLISDGSDEERQKQERLKELYAAVAKLSKVEKSLVFLYLEDKSFIEIAEILGITANNARVKMSHIRKKLKKIIPGNNG